MTCLCKWFWFTFAKACIFPILLLFLALASFPTAHIHQSCFYVGYFFLRVQSFSSSSLPVYFTPLSVSLVSSIAGGQGRRAMLEFSNEGNLYDTNTSKSETNILFWPVCQERLIIANQPEAHSYRKSCQTYTPYLYSRQIWPCNNLSHFSH